ncbi:restriction endonuclease [uncultured Methanoregula sp.]|uniref:restriction endonuclease n=1 Tax=uncultured Methanoregula sp. TaxID=1005933 RepID=UPI002AAAEC8C|nr:restriction endonuclease [uncultured Methanoregula sp.]
MKFCPECGAKQEGSPKFCPECGTKFSQFPESPEVLRPTPSSSESVSLIHSPTPQPAINSHELGLRLEEVVESIYKADGYATQRRQHMKGVVRGYNNEIDILATRGNEKIAIECKNFKSPVGISQVRDFSVKIQDLGPGWRGVFVGYSDFTEDASQFSESRNIETLDRDEVKEKWFALSVGRSGKRGEKISIEYGLPVNTGFIPATQLDLVNAEKVVVSDVKLIFHPYIRYPYHFKKVFLDPVKGKHTFDDRGTVVIDLLDNEILNSHDMGSVSGIAQTLTQTFTAKGRQENTRRKLILHEVLDNIPLSEITMKIGQDYQVTKLAVNYSKRDVNRIALGYIIDKNSRRVTYSLDSGSMFSETRDIDFIPEKKDIALDTGEVVYVPKWQIYFNAFGMVYIREVLACSGKKLEDTIAYCPNHFKVGVLAVHQKNSAVCEKCGSAFCDAHIRQCAVCKIQICENHSVICNSCKKVFCEEHISKICGICSEKVCDDCTHICKICEKVVGKDHMVKCDVCGSVVCSNCVTISGLIKKKVTCKKCK